MSTAKAGIAKMKIVEVELTKIKPYWRNPRKNDNTIPALVKSIERYGFNVPMVLDKKNVIVAGHARYRALQKLGWKTVPCVYTEMNGAELREFRVMDNRVQELSDWDEDALTVQLGKLFEGTDLAEYFGTSLDRVMDMGVYREDETPDVNIDFGAMTAKQELNVPGVDKHLARCPFCETELTKEHIIEDPEG